MGATISYLPNNNNPFRINYPYYGLFGAADVRLISDNGDPVYECKLLNGTIVCLKKTADSQRWIDTMEASPTPLATIIGRSIDDFLKATG